MKKSTIIVLTLIMISSLVYAEVGPADEDYDEWQTTRDKLIRMKKEMDELVARIEEEKKILKEYGLRRKYEVWKMDSLLKKFLHRAKTIIGERTSQSEIEKKQLLQRLYMLGLLKKDSKVEDVLNLRLKNILERRLQTLVCKKQLAKTMRQARQFITHNHIAINSQIINVPSYLVPLKEEALINFNQYSSLANTDHPERIELKLGKKLKPEEELKEMLKAQGYLD